MIRTQSFFEDIIPLKLNKAGRTKANEMFYKISIRLSCSHRVGG